MAIRKYLDRETDERLRDEEVDDWSARMGTATKITERAILQVARLHRVRQLPAETRRRMGREILDEARASVAALNLPEEGSPEHRRLMRWGFRCLKRKRS